MNTNENIELLDLRNKGELLNYYSGISKLFVDSFGKPLDQELWEWAYIKNPFGDPLVSIALHEGEVVGHYAVVPMNLENEEGVMSGFLSMTTMVAPDFRKLRLFQRLAEMVYTRIENRNHPAIVFGFPNDNSAPGFIKRLGWTVSEDYKVVCVTSDQRPAVMDFVEKAQDHKPISLNLNNPDVRSWRTSKPGQRWEYKDGIGLKMVDGTYDLMHISDASQIRNIGPDMQFNMIVKVSEVSGMDALEVSFPYRFGYRLFNTDVAPNILVQMSMSDIF